MEWFVDSMVLAKFRIGLIQSRRSSKYWKRFRFEELRETLFPDSRFDSADLLIIL